MRRCGSTTDANMPSPSSTSFTRRNAPTAWAGRFAFIRPAAREFGQVLVTEGSAAAIKRFEQMLADPARWIVTKAGLNRLGYDLLHNGHKALALEAFRLNVTLNPDDANVHDSYGEALAAIGRKAEAIEAYRRSLELKPDNEKGEAALRALERN